MSDHFKHIHGVAYVYIYIYIYIYIFITYENSISYLGGSYNFDLESFHEDIYLVLNLDIL